MVFNNDAAGRGAARHGTARRGSSQDLTPLFSGTGSFPCRRAKVVETEGRKGVAAKRTNAQRNDKRALAERASSENRGVTRWDAARKSAASL